MKRIVTDQGTDTQLIEEFAHFIGFTFHCLRWSSTRPCASSGPHPPVPQSQ